MEEGTRHSPFGSSWILNVLRPKAELSLRMKGFGGMGRKRDLKNVHTKRPPQLNLEDPETLNEWGEELARMTTRRRQHNERHKPGTKP